MFFVGTPTKSTAPCAPGSEKGDTSNPRGLSRIRDDPRLALRAAGMAGRDKSRLVHRADLPGDVSLYELLGACELVRWADRVEPVPGLLAAVDGLQARPGDLGLPGGVVAEWPASAGDPPVGGDGPIAYDWRTANELRVETNASAGGFLVFNQSYNPGWRATVNGEEVPIYRVNAVVQGVAVPAGECRVLFRYRPCGLVAGGVASLAAIGLLLSGLVATCFKNRSR